jgi:hypothetical protein
MVDLVNWYLPKSYYPPVPALLQGESPFFYAYNHLGPYRQTEYTEIPKTALGSESSVEFELDQRGYLQGLVLAIDWNDAVRTVSWATLQIRATSTTYNWYTWDGWFDGYLDAGTYPVTIYEWTALGEGHQTRELKLTVSPGQMNKAATVTLDMSEIPIPEFNGTIPIVLLTSGLLLVTSRKTIRRIGKKLRD